MGKTLLLGFSDFSSAYFCLPLYRSDHLTSTLSHIVPICPHLTSTPISHWLHLLSSDNLPPSPSPLPLRSRHAVPAHSAAGAHVGPRARARAIPPDAVQTDDCRGGGRRRRHDWARAAAGAGTVLLSCPPRSKSLFFASIAIPLTSFFSSRVSMMCRFSDLPRI